MVKYKTVIKKFADKGEKTGWTYIEVPMEIAKELNPSNKRSFRVKGTLDKYKVEGVNLIPMGGGDYIMALNAGLRKGIKKGIGDLLEVHLILDTKEKPFSQDFLDCLKEEPKAYKYYNTLTKSHQRYFSNWIDTARTDSTKAKRIVQSIKALAMELGFGEMQRLNKKTKEEMNDH